MSEIGGSQSSRAGLFPRVFFRENQPLSKVLFQMGSVKGISNQGYEHDAAMDDVELDIDYNSLVDDPEFKEKNEGSEENDEGSVHVPEKDSGRGSHEEPSPVSDKVSVESFSRVSRSGLHDEPDVLDYSSDESVGHFQLGITSSEESSSFDGNFDEGGKVLTEEEDTLEKRIEPWNVFATAPHLDAEESKQLCFALARKVMKVLTYIFMFPAMLALIILSKGSILIAVANIRPYPKIPSHVGNNTSDNSTDNGDGYDYYDPFDLGNDTTANNSFEFTTIPMQWTTPANLKDNEYYDLRCRNFTDNRTVTLRNLYNNASYEGFEIFDYIKCVAVPYGYENSERLDDLSCMNPSNGSGYLNASMAYSRDECFVVRNYWAWSVFLMLVTPYIFVFLRCFWIIMFKKKKSPTWKAIAATLIIETLHTIGISIMFFVVMPSLDNSILALIFLLGVSTIPAALKILVRPEDEKYRVLKVVLDCLATIGQAMILVIWPLVVVAERDKNYDSNLIWSIPISLLLVSVRWWENFVEKNSRLGKIRKFLNRVSGQMRRSRTKIQLMASLWKVVVTFVTMMFCMTTQVDYMDPLDMFEKKFTAMFNFGLSQCRRYDNDTGEPRYTYTISETEIPEMELDWVWMWLLNCCASLVCYFFARSSAKMRIQQSCYSLPLVISTPLMFGLMIGGCELWNSDPCVFTTSDLAGYLMYKCYRVDTIGDAWYQQMWFLLPILWLSQLWIAWHIWFPKSARLATADTLFVLPLYESVLMEQSLMLNRERNDEPRSRAKVLAPAATTQENQMEQAQLERIEMTKRDDFLEKALRKRDEVPMVFICATMWHETETEMVQMLKSIFKLDIDQAARKNAQDFFKITDPDYYEFEAHIFFDNAFNNHDPGQFDYKANDYVTLLVSVINQAAAEVHQFNLCLAPPLKYPTPYGGRLIWHLPGGNKLIAHLKDSAKIRHKKRWSQVMYMYYFLGYGLWMNSGLDRKRKQIRAENTFLLALDGDVDFEPIALILLLDLMKRNSNLGAACGRIHPNGSGPMVWYQYFEYALGHWMQKSTEHVIGCVLCSPGCFSLFRGIAVMEDNVMARYTTKPTEPRHHIQYDQGEDRWLCTLILQQGYRVEYCAASDSVTFSPEGFNEFFNQRRRWMPSTMANVLDLLQSWQHTTTANDNISLIYIIYQSFLLGASIVGPGTIFMMMVGSIDVAFGGRLDFAWCMLINLIPLLIFIILCYVAKSEVQLIFAQLLTGLYCLIQMLVLIGIVVQMAGNEICYPTTVFFLFVTGTFFLAAIIHPQECWCLIHGFTYYLAIPTMYMLLMVYSMCNLHVVSWGTREVKATPTEKQMEEMKNAEIEAKRLAEEKKKKGITGSVMAMAKGKDDQEGWTWRCGDCCSYSCCPRPARSDERIVELKLILSQMEKMGAKFEAEIAELKKVIEESKKEKVEDESEEEIDMKSMKSARSESTQSVISRQIRNIRSNSMAFRESNAGAGSAADGSQHSFESRLDDVSDDLDGSRRSSDAGSQDGEGSQRELMDGEGSKCGSHCSSEHIVTVEENANQKDEDEKKKKIENIDELVNPMWAMDPALGSGPVIPLNDDENQFFKDLIAVYLYPLLKDKIKEEKDAAALKELRNSISVAFLLLNTIFVVVIFVMQLNMDVLYIPWPCGEDMKVEPIGFMFMMTFGIIMVVQIIGMLVHRTTTFLHIMATTLLHFFGKSEDTNTEIMIELAKRLGKLGDINKMTVNTIANTFVSTIASDGRGSMMGDDIRKAQRKTIFMIQKNAERRRNAVSMSVSKAFERRLDKLNHGLEKDDVDLNKIQRNLLGGATAGFLVNRQTQEALKTYREMRHTVRDSEGPGTISSADYSVDYGSEPGESIRSRRSGTRRGVGTARSRNGTKAGSKRYSSGGIGGSVRRNPVYDSSDDPEADYGQ